LGCACFRRGTAAAVAATSRQDGLTLPELPLLLASSPPATPAAAAAAARGCRSGPAARAPAPVAGAAGFFFF
jgi:hypothetical protein